MTASPAADPPDGLFLLGLFGGEAATPFRHRLGLARGDAADELTAFYRPESPSPETLAEKRAILDGPAAPLYRLLSPGGDAALREWAALLSLALPPPASFEDETASQNHRAVTLACEPDLLLLRPPYWELIWASVCFPTRWSLAGKLHRPLHEIHAAVPELNATLARSIDVFFDRLAPGQSWQRVNWGLTAGAQRNQHPTLPLPAITPDAATEDLFLRLEHQHFCKLPASGVIAFGIRIASHRLDSVLADDALRRGLRETLRTMPPAVAAYKGIPAAWWQKL